jgi:ATP-dependent helicase/nuclease subunit A
VTISTYHRAKGLEWPVVVLGSLNKSERRSVFEVSPESDRPSFDAADPYLLNKWWRIEISRFARNDMYATNVISTLGRDLK